jgi:serine/threonine-protein kinase
MGAVYLATQVSLNRKVALKVMLRGAQAKPEELARFVREAKKALAQLSHPYILKAWDAEFDGDLAWFTMELVKGRSFKEALSSGTFPIDKGARIIAKLARAMDYAHKKGIIHRDLKPQNVMLDEGDTPKILDFGLAKTIDENTMNQLTQMGAFLGTPAYMAPEQAGGDPTQIDGRADVYALGAMLYEVLTGRPPFTGSSPLAVIKKVLGEAPVPPTKIFPGTIAVLEPVCLKALEKDPGTRYQRASELADEIEKVLGPEPAAPPQAQEGAASDGGQAQPSSKDIAKKSLFGKLLLTAA